MLFKPVNVPNALRPPCFDSLGVFSWGRCESNAEFAFSKSADQA
jgi:hypothetical protein